VLDYLLSELKGDLGESPSGNSFFEGDWRQSIVQVKGADMIRIARGYESPDGKPDESFSACWFDQNGVLRAEYSRSLTTHYDDLFVWNGKQIPRRIEILAGHGERILQSVVDDIGPAPAVPDSVFVIRGVKPQPAPQHQLGMLCGVGSR